MWLLDSSTFVLFPIHDPSQFRYAAVSHVWNNTQGEPSFQDIHALREEIERTLGSDPDEEQIQAFLERPDKHTLWSKIAGACAFARTHGYQYIWIDTCCINKMSSSELSEAVNSMFEWYAHASVCYAYLQDVPDNEHPAGERSKFRASKWFKRGWTLQELVAPRIVVFLAKNWTVLGTKHILARVIEEITHISRKVLTNEESLDSVSVAERMSWASGRQTTRVEDEAYSLLGIFGIHMPTIYGEGSQAFIRLQEEILRRIPDQTLFAWGATLSLQSPSDLRRLVVSTADTLQSVITPRTAYLFAHSTTDFYNSTGFSPLSLLQFSQRLLVADIRPPQYITTSYGLRARLPLIQLDIGGGVPVVVAPLACQNAEGSVPALVLFQHEPNQYSVGMYTFHDQPDSRGASPLEASTLRPAIRGKHPRYILLHPTVLDSLCRRVVRWENIYVIHRPPRITPQSDMLKFALASPRISRHTSLAGSCDIVIPRYTAAYLHSAGYTSTDLPVTQGSPIAVRRPGHRYSVEFRRQDPAAAPEYIKIGFSLCEEQTYPRDARPLHAVIMDWWTVPEHHLDRTSSRRVPWDGISHILADCESYHVQDWEDGERIFTFDRLGKSIQLKFSEWYSERTPLADHGINEAGRRKTFAMDVVIIDNASHPTGESYSPTEASTVAFPYTTPQWRACPWETPPPSWRFMEPAGASGIETASASTTPYSEPWLMSPAHTASGSPGSFPAMPSIDVASPGSSHGVQFNLPHASPAEGGLSSGVEPPGFVPYQPLRSILRHRPSPDFLPPPPSPSYLHPPGSPGFESTTTPPPSPTVYDREEEDEEESLEYLSSPYLTPPPEWAIASHNHLSAGEAHDEITAYNTARNGRQTGAHTLRPHAMARAVQWNPETPLSILTDASYRASRDEQARAQARDRRVRFAEAEVRPLEW